MRGLQGWPVWGGHELPCANDSLISCLPTVNFPCFPCGLHLVPPFSEAMGNTECLGQCIVVSFSTTCKRISSHISSCASFSVSRPYWLPLFVNCIWAQVPWAPLLEILACDGLFSSVSETAGSSCDQYWAVHHPCPHRSILQPLPIQNPAIFPNKNSSKKRKKLW